MSRTILIMAGGTGGHIFPGLAVADRLRAQGWNVVWLGTRGGMEGEIVPKRGYPMEWIRFSGVRRQGLLRWAGLPLFLVLACLQSARVLARRRPDVVLGMGGFATFPGGLMAALLNRPLVIHEQNAIAGLANRVLAAVADRILVGFPDAFDAASGRSNALARLFKPARKPEWTGNPVREEIAALPPPDERYGRRQGPLRVLVLGGSRGARAFNETLPRAIAALAPSERPSIVHQAGAGEAEAVARAYQEAGVEAEVHAFIDDMASRYAETDLVICRAGALTIGELAAAGVASLLVPYPYAVDDHQTANARFLSERNAALLLPQRELSPEGLAERLRTLTREALLAMAERARALAQPEATKRVAEACLEAAG
jgi:UDP-N-acetylglucosamine--N-acetylmuramyl-(pentapeptide) pyrophosphoryl-undecaprenol N-acetylglucosamine transferase